MGIFDKTKRKIVDKLSKNPMDFDSITTRGGDTGQTSTFDGRRLMKHDDMFHVIGEIDSLASSLGMLRPPFIGEFLAGLIDRSTIEWIQRQLMQIMGMINSSPDSEQYQYLEVVDESVVEELEELERQMLKYTQVPQSFVFPSSQADVARCQCRTAERMLVEYISSKGYRHLIPCQQFLNRLSDYLFVLALIDMDDEHPVS